MSFKVTVLYPNKEDTVFNMRYYLDHHLPLAERIWKPLGLLNWELVEALADKGRHRPAFCVVVTLTWKDYASYSAASASPEALEIFEDLPNVCNHEPVFVSGRLSASG